MFKKFELPNLRFDIFSFPGLSAESFDFHYNKHHKNYVENLNNLLELHGAESGYFGRDYNDNEMFLEEIIKKSYHNFRAENQCFLQDAILKSAAVSVDKKIYNNAAQHWNHSFFWESIVPEKKEITAKMAGFIESFFGSLENFKQEFFAKGASVFGSGWLWLVFDKNVQKLELVTSLNANTPIATDHLVPILACDVWEHAYYIDYRNNRGDFLKAIWSVLDWELAQNRLENALASGL